MGVATVLQIIALIEAEVPTAISLYETWKASGQSIDSFLADASAKDAATIAAAQAQIAKDQAPKA